MNKSILLDSKLLLAVILVLFLFTRLYKIEDIPSSVYWDEASIGYNAFSIAETGKDEWGEFLPIHFRAFGEFKLPVYIYAVVPFVKIFGLSAFSVRLPAVLFSSGVVILTYFLAKKLTDNKSIGLLGSFFVSISPWFFIFSRTGYEATAGLMFYMLAIYFFLKIHKQNWYILFSALSFILSAYSYNSYRIIGPLTILILLIFHLKNLKSIFKISIFPVLLSVIFLVISIIPAYRLYRYDSGASRLRAVSATSSSFIKNYLSHFSPDFLIIHGDKNLRSQQTGFGQLYLPELAFLLLGFLYLVRSKSKYKLIPLILLFLGPIPAAITKESPHALRSISMVPFIVMISAEGAIYFGQLFKNKKNLINFAVVIIFLIFFVNYFQSFLNTYPVESLKDWQYEYKRIYIDYGDKFDQYSRILISDRYAQPYIFTLFYLKYDPDKFRREVVRNSVDRWGFSTVQEFGKFEFGKFSEVVSFNK